MTQTSPPKTPGNAPPGPAPGKPPPPVLKVPQSLEELSLAPDLPPPDLALEDTAALRNRGVAVAPDPGNGYNPYDTGPPAGARAPRDAAAAAPPGKRTDLRKLSEWIRLQRQVEDLKKGGNEEPE